MVYIGSCRISIINSTFKAELFCMREKEARQVIFNPKSRRVHRSQLVEGTPSTSETLKPPIKLLGPVGVS